MRRIELLIEQARRDSDNTDYSDSTGLQDEDFCEWASNAQERLQSIISAVNAPLFQETELINSVASQEAYDLPELIHLGSFVENIEFSSNGQEDNFEDLNEIELRERPQGLVGKPEAYVLQSGQFLSSPAPVNDDGVFRVTYQKILPRIDKRRGKVSAVTLATDTITALTLDPTELAGDDAEQAINVGFLTVVDKYGTVKMKGIPISDIDTTTGVVTVDSDFVFQDGETIEVDDYVVAGEFHSSHPSLPRQCERYLLSYMTWKALKRDSSYDSKEGKEELDSMEAQIVEAYKKPNKVSRGIPIINDEYLM